MADNKYLEALIDGLEGRLSARMDAFGRDIEKLVQAYEKLRDLTNGQPKHADMERLREDVQALQIAIPKQAELNKLKTDVQELQLFRAALDGKASQRDLNITRWIAFAGVAMAIIQFIRDVTVK